MIKKPEHEHFANFQMISSSEKVLGAKLWEVSERYQNFDFIDISSLIGNAIMSYHFTDMKL